LAWSALLNPLRFLVASPRTDAPRRSPTSNKKKHKKACRHGPCFCPEPGCGFSGPAATLPDHFTDCHKWPNTSFKYFAQFGLRLQPGPHVLRAQDGTVFLMNVVAAEPLGHAISLVCVRPEATDSPFGCSVVFSCFTGHHQISTLAVVRCSSLADGLPKDGFCVVPKASGGTHVVLQTTIDTRRYMWRKTCLPAGQFGSHPVIIPVL